MGDGGCGYAARITIWMKSREREFERFRAARLGAVSLEVIPNVEPYPRPEMYPSPSTESEWSSPAPSDVPLVDESQSP
jgi:hypothetical protein